MQCFFIADAAQATHHQSHYWLVYCMNRTNTSSPWLSVIKHIRFSLASAFLDQSPIVRRLHFSVRQPRAVFICVTCMRGVCVRGNERMAHCHASGVQNVSRRWQPRYIPAKGLSSRSKLFFVFTSPSLPFVMVLEPTTNA